NGKLSYAGDGISASYARNILAYKLSFVPTTVTYDPDSETLTTGSATKDNALNNVIYATLPVDIIDFNAIPKEDHNLLTLSIVPTDEQKTIDVQKSENGTDFYSLGAMAQTENTPDAMVYQYHDKNIQPLQTYYYRIKTIDGTGAIKYSKIIRITSQSESSGVKISPNPGDKQVLIQWSQLPGNNNNTTEIKLLNITGRLVWGKKTTDNHIAVNTSTMPAGTYLVQIKQNSEAILNKKLIIRR
ncbi:MAG TPA: T9SS type A sorting domain-containing protein, partial [Chitinophagaceae bacterium]|nr:T9SS type A sorting domain-containing protein [Chitinophagaceae bacterium]